MSDLLAQASTLTVQTTDTRERMRGGQKVTLRTTRQFTVRRPDRIAVQVTGDTDLKGWYDGQKLTFVSDPQKVWVRVNAAPTIDDTLDRMAERLAMPMPMADFLYSSPYDALIGIGVDRRLRRPRNRGAAWPACTWRTSIPASTGTCGCPNRAIRCRRSSASPTRPSRRRARSTVVFDQWALGAPVTDATFTPVVPAGYERIPLVVQADDRPG